MSLCPFANDNLSVDEVIRFEIRSGIRTDAPEGDLCCSLTKKFWLMNMERTLAI